MARVFAGKPFVFFVESSEMGFYAGFGFTLLLLLLSHGPIIGRGRLHPRG
jgi:hypothetical protein